MGAKGKPKDPGSGRKLGTPNKKTIDLHEKCLAMGVDPWEKMVEFLVYEGEPALRLQAAKELCKYLYPQRKAVEHSGEINNPYLEKPIEELEAMVKKALKEKK